MAPKADIGVPPPAYLVLRSKQKIPSPLAGLGREERTKGQGEG
jgi:hypothetical protein